MPDIRQCSAALTGGVPDTRQCSAALTGGVTDTRQCSAALTGGAPDTRQCSADGGGVADVSQTLPPFPGAPPRPIPLRTERETGLNWPGN